MTKPFNEYLKRIHDMNAEIEQNRKRKWLELEKAVYGMEPLQTFNVRENRHAG
jgi:hypothetical protein